jgi:competence protein ComEC
MSEAYETARRDGWHALHDAEIGVLALVTIVAVWLGASPWCLAGLVAAGAVLPRRRTLGVLAAVLLVAGAAAGERAWDRAEPRLLGPFSGWARLAADPAPAGRGVAAVLEIGGERFRTSAFGSPRRRLERRQAGDLVEVVGRRVPLAPDDRWSRARHVVGRFEIERVGSWREGAPIDRAGNRLRDRFRRAAEASMGADDAALFTGLVVGDDTRQSREVIDRFRAVGLSHLTAVSGQNVAYVLAAVGVVLTRLPRWWRLGATWALIAWFVVLTRVEPSVVRAGTMAGIAALAFATGRDRSVPRLLGLTVIVLVLVDPMLVWSVGFWLSCGATFGVSVVAPWLASRWRGPAWLAGPVSTAVGAQLGVVVPSLLVFGRMPAFGIVANLLAVPVAGAVMLVGMPAALVASALPGPGAAIVMAPVSLGTHWVATVALVAERVTPTGGAAVLAWAAQVAIGCWWWRRAPAGHDGAVMAPSRPARPRPSSSLPGADR